MLQININTNDTYTFNYYLPFNNCYLLSTLNSMWFLSLSMSNHFIFTKEKTEFEPAENSPADLNG